jgi:hypothetical protein
MSEETTTTEEQLTGLSIGDLAGLRQIIAVAAQRGAFKAEEMEVVGHHYNRLNAFVQSVAPQTEEATEEATEETSTEE